MRAENKVKGQGATEYLLMLAAVLIIVAVAIYVIMAPWGPTIVTTARLKADNTVWLRGENGCSKITNWSFEYRGGLVTTWQSGSGSIGPGDEIRLTALAGAVKLGDTVFIKYDGKVDELTVKAY